MLNRNEVEIRTQLHLMDAEGLHNEKPTVEEITELLKKENFIPTSLEIWHDNIMNLWAWSTDIKEIK